MIDTNHSTKPWASKTAQKITIVLLVTQLIGCAVDMMEPQATLMALFCMASVSDNAALEWAGGVVWLVLAFSWLVGLLAIKFGKMRPVYWLLLGLIPVAMVTQHGLLNADVLYCDAP